MCSIINVAGMETKEEDEHFLAMKMVFVKFFWWLNRLWQGQTVAQCFRSNHEILELGRSHFDVNWTKHGSILK